MGKHLTVRQRAIDAGTTTYEPRDPCRHGHKLRYAKTGHCVECRRNKRGKGSMAMRSRQRAINLTDKQRRMQALADGLQTYRTLKPCTWSHLNRLSISGACVACTRQRAIDVADDPHKLAHKRDMDRQRQAAKRQRVKAAALANGDTIRAPGRPANLSSIVEPQSSTVLAQIINCLLTCNV